MSDHPGINSALFRFCTELNDGPSAEASSEPSTRATKEDLEWLKQAMKAVEPPEKIMNKLLDAIKDPETSEDDAVELLQELGDHVEDINWALDFKICNGPVQLLFQMKKGIEKASVRKETAMVIGNSAQHHPEVQQAYIDLKFADTLVPLLVAERDNACRAATLHAISSMCRECSGGTAAFLQAKGLEAIAGLLLSHRNDKKSCARALFLADYLCSQGIAATEVISSAAAMVTDQNDNVATRAASMLLVALERDAAAVTPLVKKQIGADLASLRTSDIDEVKELVQKLEKE